MLLSVVAPGYNEVPVPSAFWDLPSAREALFGNGDSNDRTAEVLSGLRRGSGMTNLRRPEATPPRAVVCRRENAGSTADGGPR